MDTKNVLSTDDPEVLKALETSFLGRGGFNIFKAQSAEEAFQLMEEFDLVLSVLCLDMPGLEDGTFLQRVKKDSLLSSTPLIAIDSLENQSNTSEYPYDALLKKPLNISEFQATLCRLLGAYERKHTRHDVAWRLFLETDKGKRHSARILNISEGGLFVKSEVLFPIGTQLTLKGWANTPLHGISTHVSVIWVNHPEWIKTSRFPGGMGLEFQVCPDAVISFIRKLEHPTKKEN